MVTFETATLSVTVAFILTIVFKTTVEVALIKAFDIVGAVVSAAATTVALAVPETALPEMYL